MGILVLLTFLLFVFFSSDIEKRPKGLGYEYIVENEYTFFLNAYPSAPSGTPRGVFRDFVTIDDNKYYVICSMDISQYEGVPPGTTFDVAYVTMYLSPTYEYSRYSSPFIELKANGFVSKTGFEKYDCSLVVTEIETPVSSKLFIEVIGNCVSRFQENTMEWEDVDGVIDFLEFIYSFIKEIILLIYNIFNTLGVLL